MKKAVTLCAWILASGCATSTAPAAIPCVGEVTPAEFSVYPGGQETVWRNRWQEPHRTADTIPLWDGGRMIIAKYADEARTTPACLTLADSVTMHMPESFWRPAR